MGGERHLVKIPIFRNCLCWSDWALDLVPATIKLNKRYSWAVRFGSCNAIIEDKCHESQYKGNGRWKTIQRAGHVVMVEAWAQIRDDGRTVIIRAGNLHRRLESGPDHYWQHDALGFALVRISDQEDYHPSAENLMAPGPNGYFDGEATVNSIKRSIEWAAIRRAEITSRNQTLIDGDLDGVWVSFVDSLRAGNCREGSRQWAAQKRINIRHHHLAAKLMDLGWQDGRLVAAVKMAVARHKREMAEGFCALCDHIDKEVTA